MCGLGFLQYLFINSFVTYIAFGFVINSLACGLEAVCVTLVLEMFTTSKRTIFGIGIEVVWVIVLAAMAPLAYAIKAWKEIRLVIFALLAVLTVVSPWLAQESVRWLISMGKLEKAVKIIDKLVKYNKLDKSKSKRNKLNQMFADLSLYNKMLEKQTKNNALSKESKYFCKLNYYFFFQIARAICFNLNIDRSTAIN
jgi:endonuclease/exonuclease/phosphatase (EEP) superfamily protein YafD